MHCDCCLDATVIIAYLECVLSLYLLSLSICGLFWLPREENLCTVCCWKQSGCVVCAVSQLYTLASLQVCPQVEKFILGHLKTASANSALAKRLIQSPTGFELACREATCVTDRTDIHQGRCQPAGWKQPQTWLRSSVCSIVVIFTSMFSKVNSRGANLAGSFSVLRKHAYKDSLFPLTAQILIPAASITTADCLLLYSRSASVQVPVSHCFWGEKKCEFWPKLGVVMQMAGISWGQAVDGF